MVSKEDLKTIILSNKKMILNQVGKIIQREHIYFPEELRKVAVLYGVRRSGKTFVLFDLFRKYKNESLYIDFEDERLVDFALSDFESLKEAFLELNPQLLEKKKVFLLDEIQNISGWEKFCRRAVEKENISIFVAGSSSKIMPMEVHTSLRGRAWGIEITPFSFKEYLLTKGIRADENFIYGSEKVLIKRYFSEYMEWGGFPEISFAKNEFEKNKIIKEYLGSMFFKDLVERFNINNIHLLDLMIDKLFSSFACKISLTAFYKQYKNRTAFSKDTLFNYYRYFLASMLVFEVRKFSESTYKRLRNPAKIYIIDPGILRRVTSKDMGRALENIVFLELRRKADEIFYFEEERECDFIAKENATFSPYQVCFELTKENRERELDGLILACKWVGANSGILLTYDQEEVIARDGIEITIIPVWKWILKR